MSLCKPALDCRSVLRKRSRVLHGTVIGNWMKTCRVYLRTKNTQTYVFSIGFITETILLLLRYIGEDSRNCTVHRQLRGWRTFPTASLPAERSVRRYVDVEETIAIAACHGSAPIYQSTHDAVPYLVLPLSLYWPNQSRWSHIVGHYDLRTSAPLISMWGVHERSYLRTHVVTRKNLIRRVVDAVIRIITETPITRFTVKRAGICIEAEGGYFEHRYSSGSPWYLEPCIRLVLQKTCLSYSDHLYFPYP